LNLVIRFLRLSGRQLCCHKGKTLQAAKMPTRIRRALLYKSLMFSMIFLMQEKWPANSRVANYAAGTNQDSARQRKLKRFFNHGWTRINTGGMAVYSIPGRSQPGAAAFPAFKHLRIRVHLCPSVVKIFSEDLVSPKNPLGRRRANIFPLRPAGPKY
jgi:hypothetical protein